MLEPYSLQIHFDNFQGKHEINSATFTVFLDAYKEIAEVYGVNLEIQIGVPEEGGWLTKIFLSISFIGGLSPFVPLLTGESSDDLAKKGHKYILQKINEFITEEARNLPEQLPRECIKQKNRMYEQFQKDTCVDTFHLADFPPIPRSDFYLYIKEVQEDEYVYLGEAEITVHSPDWSGRRSWNGKINIVAESTSSFAFDKDLTGRFWEMVKLDSLPLHTKDVMKVQLVKRPTEKVKYLVVRVVSYNDQEVDSQLNEEEIQKITTLVRVQRPIADKDNQGDLFS